MMTRMESEYQSDDSNVYNSTYTKIAHNALHHRPAAHIQASARPVTTSPGECPSPSPSVESNDMEYEHGSFSPGLGPSGSSSPTAAHVHNEMGPHGIKARPQHMIPIFLGLMPYVMGTIFGRSDTWMEISFFILVISWLYLTLKVPWDIYFSLLKTKRLQSEKGFVKSSYTVLETGSICLIFLSPFIAVHGILSFQAYYSSSQTARFISGFNVHLFILAVLIPAIKYFLDPDSNQKSDSVSLSKPVQNPIWVKSMVDRIEQLEQVNNRRSALPSTSTSVGSNSATIHHAMVPFTHNNRAHGLRAKRISAHGQRNSFSLLWVVFILMTWPYWAIRWTKNRILSLLGLFAFVFGIKNSEQYPEESSVNTD